MFLQVGGWYVVFGYAVDVTDTRLFGGCQETYGRRRLRRQRVSTAGTQGQQVRKSFQTLVALREEAIRLFSLRLREDKELLLVPATRMLSTVSSTLFPSAHDRDAPASCPPSSQVLNNLAKLREEPPSDEGSTVDEGAPPAGAGWRGTGRPMMTAPASSAMGSHWHLQAGGNPMLGNILEVRVGRKCPHCTWGLLAESERRVC